MFFIDTCILSVLLVSAIVSIIRGLTKEILSLLSWFFGFALIIITFQPISISLNNFGIKSPLNYVIAFLAVWILVLFLTRLINGLIKKIFKGLGIVWLDHFLGFFFGVIRGLLISWLIIWGIGVILGQDHKFLQDSYFVEFFSKFDFLVIEENLHKYLSSLSVGVDFMKYLKN